MLRICLPGTGGMIPLPERYLTCCFAEYQGHSLLIDCGEGTQVALKAAGCRLSRLELILITHCHADHVAGLPGLLLTLGNTGKTSPLLIIGPGGTKAVVESLMVIAAALPYPVYLLEADCAREDLPGFEGCDEMSVACLPLRHWVPCLGYRITIRRKPVFNPQKAEALGIPKPLYRRLHEGKPVSLPDGREILPEQVLDAQRPPFRFCYCTDTLPIPEIADFARGSDLFIAEGLYGDDAMRSKVTEKRHSLFSDSARLAKEAGVSRLWLTHYSPALKDPSSEIESALAYFEQSFAAKDGDWIELG